MTIFEWDKSKNQANIAKHGVSFETARKAFLDPNNIITADPKHSAYEERRSCIAKVDGNVITVIYTKRKAKIRIISAGYWRNGRKRYEEQSEKR